MDTWQIQAFFKKIHRSLIQFKHSYSTAFLSAREAQCLQRGTEMITSNQNKHTLPTKKTLNQTEELATQSEIKLTQPKLLLGFNTKP